MMASAGGGGVLTVGTCAIKFLTKWGHYPLFIDGFLSAINYAASFVLMQLIGFTLATKQPSMTAAALAGTLRESRGDQGLDELVTIIVRICRSQLAAAIGNIGLVIPAAIGFDMVYQAMRGEPFLDHATAVKTVGSFHLLDSGTFFYAALTGVLLWCSSLAAGWLENWATYRRLPEALAEHRIQRLVGRRTTEWVAARFARHVSGFGGNVTLGFLLGMTPIMGTFFGLPLDVRHVTLSTGSLVLAILSGGLPVLASSELAWAVVGIVCIGLLNFGVSFALALAVALRAREVQASYKWRLARAVLRRFAQRPMPFFFPPRTGG
jgi:site-specific recombinase